MGLDKFPFPGKQIIIVGEFLQLSSAGQFLFKSRVFEHAITHRFELTKVMQQYEMDKMFISVVSEFRIGRCSQATANFPQVAENATSIFFKRNGALLHNRSALDKKEGELFSTL